MDKDIFKDMMNTLVGNIQDEHDKIYGEISNILEAVEDPERFDITFIYEIKCMVETFLRKKGYVKHLEMAMIYMNYNMYEHNVSYPIKIAEGSACSVDKARFIVNSYLEFLKTETLPDMTIDEKCYWKPKFGSAFQWMAYMKGISALINGDPQHYMIASRELFQAMNEKLAKP